MIELVCSDLNLFMANTLQTLFTYINFSHKRGRLNSLSKLYPSLPSVLLSMRNAGYKQKITI